MNTSSIYFLLACSLAIGCSLASQAGVNSQLRLAVSSPIQAAFLSFFIGTVILGRLSLLQGNTWFKSGSIANIPWWSWLGGVCGAFNIVMSVFLAPS